MNDYILYYGIISIILMFSGFIVTLIIDKGKRVVYNLISSILCGLFWPATILLGALTIVFLGIYFISKEVKHE